MIRATLSLGLLALLGLADPGVRPSPMTFQEEGETSASTIAADLGLGEDAVSPVDGDELDEVRRALAKHYTGKSRRFLDGLRLARVRGVARDGGEAAWFVAQVPLAGDLEGARWTVAVLEDGRLQLGALKGDERFEGERAFDWNTFQMQSFVTSMRFQKPFPLDPETTPLERERRRIARSLESSKPETALVRALARQRMLMRENSMLGIAAFPPPQGRGVEGGQWALEWSENLRELATLADVFEPILGAEGRALFEKDALDAAKLSEEIGAELEEGADLRSVMQRLGPACSTCHDRSDHGLGDSSLQTAFEATLESNGLPRGLYLVGADVWPVSGEEGASQAAADGMRLSALALGAWLD